MLGRRQTDIHILEQKLGYKCCNWIKTIVSRSRRM